MATMQSCFKVCDINFIHKEANIHVVPTNLYCTWTFTFIFKNMAPTMYRFLF